MPWGAHRAAPDQFSHSGVPIIRVEGITKVAMKGIGWIAVRLSGGATTAVEMRHYEYVPHVPSLPPNR